MVVPRRWDGGFGIEIELGCNGVLVFKHGYIDTFSDTRDETFLVFI